MSERKFSEEELFDQEELDEPTGEEILADITEDFNEHANVFPDFDKRLAQEILTAANANFKYKAEDWSDLLMRLQAVIDDYKKADEETDEDDLRSELQGLLSEARDLTVH